MNLIDCLAGVDREMDVNQKPGLCSYFYIPKIPVLDMLSHNLHLGFRICVRLRDLTI